MSPLSIPARIVGPSSATRPPASGELMLMLLADARLPTGAHTQSAGLEPAMNAGLRASEIPNYIRARLRTVTAVEAGTAVVARHLAQRPDIAAGLALTDQEWRARTVSPALREMSVLLGRGYSRLVRRLWPEHAAVQALADLDTPCRAVVLGVCAACCELEPATLARLIGYEEAQTVASAALKISPLDPIAATAWVLGAQNDIEEMAAAVSGLTDPNDIPAFGAPLIEKWAEMHATTSRRLFRA